MMIVPESNKTYVRELYLHYIFFNICMFFLHIYIFCKYLCFTSMYSLKSPISCCDKTLKFNIFIILYY